MAKQRLMIQRLSIQLTVQYQQVSCIESADWKCFVRIVRTCNLDSILVPYVRQNSKFVFIYLIIYLCINLTTDHLFCIRQMLEKKWEYNEAVHQLFIDFKKAYDSVRREVLYNIIMAFVCVYS